MVLEVVSSKSVRKDTQVLRRLYWKPYCGIRLVDAAKRPRGSRFYGAEAAATRQHVRATGGCGRTSSAAGFGSANKRIRSGTRATRSTSERLTETAAKLRLLVIELADAAIANEISESRSCPRALSRCR